jgi:hypothetical protein
MGESQPNLAILAEALNLLELPALSPTIRVVPPSEQVRFSICADDGRPIEISVYFYRRRNREGSGGTNVFIKG